MTIVIDGGVELNPVALRALRDSMVGIKAKPAANKKKNENCVGKCSYDVRGQRR